VFVAGCIDNVVWTRTAWCDGLVPNAHPSAEENQYGIFIDLCNRAGCV